MGICDRESREFDRRWGYAKFKVRQFRYVTDKVA